MLQPHYPKTGTLSDACTGRYQERDAIKKDIALELSLFKK
jgi:hypothetical protein